jgi:hypothetical protein
MTRVVVHIDKLMLRGIDRAKAAVVSAQIQAQLKRSFTAPGSADAIAVAGDSRRIVLNHPQPVKALSGAAIGDSIASCIIKGAKS